VEEETNKPKDVEEWIELAGQAADEGDSKKAREYLQNVFSVKPHWTDLEEKLMETF